MTRFDETWHRLLEWTSGQTPSERMAALAVDAEGYMGIDPSHPLGGKDGGADALVHLDGQPWVMAAYFPRGQQTIAEITSKLTTDIAAAKKKVPDLVGLVFVTNQELRLAEREDLRAIDADIRIDLIHLERLTTVLDRPQMALVREQFLDISSGARPILVLAEITGSARSFDRAAEVLNAVVEIEQDDLRKQNSQRPAASPPSFLPGFGLPSAPAPLSAEELDRRIEEIRSSVAARWESCKDYLAGIVWPAVGFKITNQEKSFLTNVQVILTLHGARGLDFADLDDFEWERFKDPAWEPPPGPFGFTPSIPVFTPAGYPVSWEHNEAGDLEITIDLPELRPHPPWRHTENDVVVIVDDPTKSSVTVTYTVTAHGYGTFFEGDPFELPVIRVDMVDSVSEAIGSQRETDDA